MNALLPTNVYSEQILIAFPDETWETHSLLGGWQVRISPAGEVVVQNPDKEGNFRWFANIHSPLTIKEASLFPQQLQLERHYVSPSFSVFADEEHKVPSNRKLVCGDVKPICGKFGGRWYFLAEENWRPSAIFTINDKNDVTAIHLTAFKKREISRRSLDAFKEVVAYPPSSFEDLTVNLFTGNDVRNLGNRGLHLLRFKDQTLAKPIELPWPNTKWMLITDSAFDETSWTEIQVSDNEVQIAPTKVLGVTYDMWAGYAFWQIVSKGYLPGLSINEVIPPTR